jgi:hypothetical protein
MRITAEDKVKVLLDGVDVVSFISADDQAGWVRVSSTEVKRGKVEIVSVGAAPKRSGALGRR